MANSNTPFGFRPVGNLNGSPYNGALIKVAFEDENATAMFIGDLVCLEGSADTEGNPTVHQSADEDTDHFGVIVAFEPDRTNLERKHRLASTTRTGYVAPATQGALFVVQANGTIAATDIGNVADILVGSGNTTNGLSSMEITNVGQGNLHLMALYPSPDNEFGANAKVIVRINENAFGGDGTGV